MMALRGWALRRLLPRGATGPGVAEMGADLWPRLDGAVVRGSGVVVSGYDGSV
ncbi:hypothetical protein CASFOL_036495 [Castilleja foliolosa]